MDGVAKMVLNDFLRGKIPWFTPPPVVEGDDVKEKDGSRDEKLGFTHKKRKRELEHHISPQVKRKLNALANRQSKGEGLWSVSSRARPNEVGEAVKASGSYDAWAPDDDESARQAAIPDDIRPIVSIPKPKVRGWLSSRMCALQLRTGSHFTEEASSAARTQTTRRRTPASRDVLQSYSN